MKKNSYLEKHKWAISQGNDGYWRTYLPDEKKGRKMIKKSSKEDLEESVVNFYKEMRKKQKNYDQYKFKVRFAVWIERQKMCERSDNTIYKYHTDYNRFFKDRIIEEMDIRKIDEAIIISSLKEVLSEKDIPYRALKAAFGYINGVFEKSIIDKVVDCNPCKYVDLLVLKKYCKSKTDFTAKARTISKTEKARILDKIENSSNLVRFAVEFAFSTGMRVGELAALKWSDIDFHKNTVTINSSEKYNRLTGEYFISTTKNDKIRTIPLTTKMKKILEENKEEEMKMGCLSEFVFMNEKGRIHCRTISEWMRNNTTTSEFEHSKSIHAIRRTINSNMRCSGVPASIAASLLGHTEKVNEENYTYDISDMNDKENILKAASGEF